MEAKQIKNTRGKQRNKTKIDITKYYSEYSD